MYNYYKSLPGYLSLIANMSLGGGIVMLFLNWYVSIPLFVATVILWSVARRVHKKRVIASLVVSGLDESAKVLVRKYKSPEGIAELKKKGFSDKSIRRMQDMAEEAAKKGVFGKDSR